jgi:PhnB protein
MQSREQPESLHALTPTGPSERADKLIAFLRRAFRAAEKIRVTQRDGVTTHCELQIGGSRIHIGHAAEGDPSHALDAQLFVPDSDAVFARALEVGATEVTPMTEMYLGTREGRVMDPFGNTWTIRA